MTRRQRPRETARPHALGGAVAVRCTATPIATAGGIGATTDNHGGRLRGPSVIAAGPLTATATVTASSPANGWRTRRTVQAPALWTPPPTTQEHRR